MNLLDSFQRYIDENDLATHDDRILLTVSGGLDSMVMLSLFTRCGYRVGVAHCNFQLRGAESDEDEVLVEDEAKKHGAAFYNRRFETRAEMERTNTATRWWRSPTMPTTRSKPFSSTCCAEPACGG